MANPPGQFSSLRWLHALVVITGIAGGLALILLGVVGVDSPARALMVVGGGFLLAVSIMLISVVPLLTRLEATFARQVSEIRELRQGVAMQTGHLEAIAENTAISDAAKSLARRQQELTMLTEAIRDDLRNQRWEAAVRLIQELENRFGEQEQVASMREEMDAARGDAIRSKLAEAIEVIEVHFKAHDWDRAQAEIDRLKAALPENARVAGLADRMKILREQHKQELMKAWEEATHRSDTDHAIEILRELDQYLSPAEGHALQNSARHVFKEKLLQLGVQFRFAVNEKRWADALATGLILVRDFPNARMTGEVREALDTLRVRASQQEEDSSVASSS